MILIFIRAFFNLVNRFTGFNLFNAQPNVPSISNNEQGPPSPPRLPPSSGKRPIRRGKLVTVLFAEILGLDEMSSYLHEKKVNDLMDRWHRTLGVIANDFSVCEIGTMDDTFACVTNLFYEQRDHAAVMARFGICVVKASELTRLDPEDFTVGMLKIRVGIHSGPCTAMHNPGFTLLGDTMNMAFQMTRHSQPGRMQCSADSAHLITVQDSSIVLNERGLIRVRHKGLQRTYWIERMNIVLSEKIHAKENKNFTCKSSTAVLNELFGSFHHAKHNKGHRADQEQHG
jgi:class 3 adenylate cyclase